MCWTSRLPAVVGWPRWRSRRAATLDAGDLVAAYAAAINQAETARAVAAETKVPAIDIRAVLPVKLPDAIIAASALIEGLPLMTRNVDDFKHIPGLTVIDPFRE